MSQSDSPVEPVQSFIRGLSVIRCFREGASRLTLTDVARKSDLSRAAARRFLYTLLSENYAETDGKYFWLTPRILDLGYSYLSSMELADFSYEHLNKLREKVGESTSMSVLDGTDVVYVMRAPTKRLLKSFVSVGTRIPAHLVSMGRIQLAMLPDKELEVYLSNADFTQYTPKTVADSDELRRAILADREKGYSIVDRELELGIAGMGVAICDQRGSCLAGINVSLSPDRLTDSAGMETVLQHLLETKASLEEVVRAGG